MESGFYASNRGNDTIAVFEVDPGKGTLRLVADVPTEAKSRGTSPLIREGSYLLAENENSDTIVTFRINAALAANSRQPATSLKYLRLCALAFPDTLASPARTRKTAHFRRM